MYGETTCKETLYKPTQGPHNVKLKKSQSKQVKINNPNR